MPEVRMKKFTVSALADVGAFFGVPITTCEYWRKQGMPGDPGAWDLREITRWRIAKIDEVSTDLNAELKRADIRLKTAQAEQRELETAKERKELLPTGDVELWATTAVVECREHIMSIPETLAVSMPPEHREFVREEADRICRGTLIALQRDLERDPVESDEVSDAAAENEIG